MADTQAPAPAKRAVVPDAAVREAVVQVTAGLATAPRGLNTSHPPPEWQAKRLRFTKRVIAAADHHIASLKLQDKWAAYKPFLNFYQEPATDLIVDITADIMGRFRTHEEDPAQDWQDCVGVIPGDVPNNVRLLGKKDDGGLPDAKRLLSKLRPFFGVAKLLGIDIKDLMRGASESLQDLNMSSSGYLLRSAFGFLASVGEVRKADNVFQAVSRLFSAVLEGIQSPSFLLLALWNALLDLVNFGTSMTSFKGVASTLSGAVSGLLSAVTDRSQLKALVFKLLAAAVLLIVFVLAIWFLPYQTALFTLASVTVTAAQKLYDTCGAFLDEVWGSVKRGLAALGATLTDLGAAIKKQLPVAVLDYMDRLGNYGAQVGSWLSSAWDWVRKRLAGADKVDSYRDAIEYAAAAAQFRHICKPTPSPAATTGGRRGTHFFQADARSAGVVVRALCREANCKAIATGCPGLRKPQGGRCRSRRAPHGTRHQHGHHRQAQHLLTSGHR